jgi:lipoprotein NlpI
MLLGRISPDKLLQAAVSEDRGIERDQLCEAYFYIGQKYLWEGRPDQARASFEKSAAQEALPYAEYGYALNELGRAKVSRLENASWRL